MSTHLFFIFYLTTKSNHHIIIVNQKDKFIFFDSFVEHINQKGKICLLSQKKRKTLSISGSTFQIQIQWLFVMNTAKDYICTATKSCGQMNGAICAFACAVGTQKQLVNGCGRFYRFITKGVNYTGTMFK